MVRLGCGGLWGRFSGQEGEGSVWGREAGHSMGGVHPQPGGESDMRSHRRAKLWRAQELHPVRLEERAHLLRAVMLLSTTARLSLQLGFAGGARWKPPASMEPRRREPLPGARKAERKQRGCYYQILFLHCNN